MQRVIKLVGAVIAAQFAFGCSTPTSDTSAGGQPVKVKSPKTTRVDTGRIRVSLSATDTAKYLHFMADKKLTDTVTYQSPDLDTAQVLDAVLIAKAITLGGGNADFEFAKIPNSERERAMVLSGDITIAGTSQWDWWADENADAVYKSDVVVPNGSFEKGLYTTKARAEALTIKTQDDLTSITCVSNKSWRVDWNTLSRLKFKSLEAAPNTETMFKMVEGGHADLTVQSFSGTQDMSISVAGITLYPVKGWKVLLDGSRHYVVSKKNPHGKAAFEALQKGLAIMKRSDEVARALTESGFFNVNVKDWKSIQSK